MGFQTTACIMFPIVIQNKTFCFETKCTKVSYINSCIRGKHCFFFWHLFFSNQNIGTLLNYFHFKRTLKNSINIPHNAEQDPYPIKIFSCKIDEVYNPSLLTECLTWMVSIFVHMTWYEYTNPIEAVCV